MNRWMIHVLLVCLPVVLLLAGCQPKAQTFVPVTGGEKVSLPEPVALTRQSVLEYILSSARLVNIPPAGDWQLDAGEQREGVYRFHSGDWLMLVSFAGTVDGNQRVVILNKAENASWTGYVTPDGRVVDTAYGR